jgi:hypothetical protein
MKYEMPLLRRLGFALLTASVPLLVMILLLTAQGLHWDDYAPSMGDEIMYWHQAATWTRVGLDSGIYSIDSMPAKAANYFCWGLGPVIFYGTFGTLFGWSLNSILYINSIFFFVCVVVFVLLARLDWWRCAWLAVMLVVYPALLVYLPTSMIEPIHLGGALVVAGGLYRLHKGERDLWLILLTGLTLLLLCFLKITWVPILWPFFYYLTSWPERPLRTMSADSNSQTYDAILLPKGNVWRAMILTGVVGIVIYLFYSYTSAPYPYDIALALADLRVDVASAFWRYVGLIAENVLWLFHPAHITSNGVRLAVVGLMIWAFVQRRRARRRADRDANLLLFYIMSVIVGLSLFVYVTEGHRGFRLFTPTVLLTFGLLLAWNRMTVVRALVALFIVTLPMVLLSPEFNHQGYFDPKRPAQIAVHQQEFREAGIVYRAGADPWCNAFAHNISYLSNLQDQDRLLAVEPGLGMTILWLKPEQATPAQFVMLDDQNYQLYPDTASLTPLLPVKGGMLYRNNATDCP